MSDSNAARLKHLVAIETTLEVECGVTPAVSALFTALGYGFQSSSAELPSRAAREYQGPASPTEEQCRLALIECLARGWLRVLTENDRSAIANDLANGGYFGPIAGSLPRAGCVDFTHLGRTIVDEIHTRFATGEPVEYSCSKVVHTKSSQYFRTRRRAEKAIEETCRDWHSLNISGPNPIGPWRAQWWRRFPEGYRIDIEERDLWCGREVGDTCSLWSNYSDAQKSRLQDVLDRHNVAFGEWVLLAAMEGGRRWTRYDRPNWLKGFSKRNFGRIPSLEEFRAAMKACLNYGWLRFLDYPDLAEVRSFLERDSAILAVPKTARLCDRGTSFVFDSSGKLVSAPRESGRLLEIDFTIAGSELYRAIAEEWLGPDWEDGLRVEHCHYCETHHYATSKQSFDRALIEPAASGNVLRASRVAPIGPWCVFWWMRFPSGYRLEIEASVT